MILHNQFGDSAQPSYFAHRAPFHQRGSILAIQILLQHQFGDSSLLCASLDEAPSVELPPRPEDIRCMLSLSGAGELVTAGEGLRDNASALLVVRVSRSAATAAFNPPKSHAFLCWTKTLFIMSVYRSP